MRSTYFTSLLLLAACKPATNFEGGELSLCIATDAQTSIHPTETASWDVTGSVTGITELDGSAVAGLDCAESAAYAVDIQKLNGDTWTVAYGITDNSGDQVAPMLDISVNDTVNLLFRQSKNSATSRGFVLHNGEGLVVAMDDGIAGSALDSADVAGLFVRRGIDVGENKEDCGKRAGTQIEFRTGDWLQLAPFSISQVSIDDHQYDVYAVSAYYWSKGKCDENVDELAWAVIR